MNLTSWIPPPYGHVSCSQSFLPQWSTHIRNSQGVENLLRIQIPKTKRVGTTNTQTRLEDTDRFHKVRGENELVLPVDAETVRRELLSQDVEGTLHIFGPLVDDIEVGICLDETSRTGAHRRAHVGDVEATVGLCTDFICDGAQQSTVALLELGAVGVGGIEVERRVLGLVSLKC